MNRTDRLYAIVEELRAVAPRPRSARRLAERFEVSVRTIERDIGALQQTGVAIYAEPGRTGGYVLDPTMTLPPLNLSPWEALAMTVALGRLEGSPFASAAASARAKVFAVMRPEDRAAAARLAGRIRFLDAPDASVPRPIPPALASAVDAGRVLHIRYVDKTGAATERDVEPMGFIGSAAGWFLIAWCRMRDAPRAFRTDRIAHLEVTDEATPAREFDPEALDIPFGGLRELPGT